MDKTVVTTATKFASDVTADKRLVALEKTAVEAVAALVNLAAGNHVEASVAVADDGAWAVVRIAPFNVAE